MNRMKCKCGRIMYYDNKICSHCGLTQNHFQYTNEEIPRRKEYKEIFIHIIENFPSANMETIVYTELTEENIKENKTATLYFPYCWDKIDWKKINYCVEWDYPNSNVKYFGISKLVSENISMSLINNFLKLLGRENQFGIIMIC